ncbi:hypothetical protein RJT34_04947 [Clitoria ternatea]|uniref:Uncharacterized protein n=1 Tax=Clitoria ternatea TaxID=43366 RepID=A0AAN9Q2R3_CLITE
MFPILLDDQPLFTEFELFVEAIDNKHELALSRHQQFPGVYALLFCKRSVPSVGYRLAGSTGKLRFSLVLCVREFMFIDMWLASIVIENIVIQRDDIALEYPCSMEVVNAEDLNSGCYTIDDAILPMPGGNKSKALRKAILALSGISGKRGHDAFLSVKKSLLSTPGKPG